MSSDMLKLYESSNSPMSRRVQIFLAEKGIYVSRVPVDLGTKEQLSEAYVRINPRRVVPTLVIEDGTARQPCVFWRRPNPARRCSAHRPRKRRW